MEPIFRNADFLAREGGCFGEREFATAGEPDDVAGCRAGGEGPVWPVVWLEVEEVADHAQRGVLDVGADCFAGQVDLNVLVIGGDEVVSVAGDGGRAAGYEAVVVGRVGGGVEAGLNVVLKVGFDGCFAEACRWKSGDEFAAGVCELVWRGEDTGCRGLCCGFHPVSIVTSCSWTR